MPRINTGQNGLAKKVGVNKQLSVKVHGMLTLRVFAKIDRQYDTGYKLMVGGLDLIILMKHVIYKVDNFVIVGKNL